MKTKKPPALNESTTATANEIAAMLGITGRRLNQLAHEGVVSMPASRGAWPVFATIRAILDYYRDRSESVNNAILAARARKAEAEAALAEIEMEKERDTLVLRADVAAVWKDVFTKQMQVIRSADYIPQASRERLAKGFREIRPDPPE